jgi:DeoR family transcriptional regulator, suf operon transcriptional repressor
LRTIAETMPEQLGPILRTQWRKKLEEYQPHLVQGSLGDRLAMLVALRRGEGFMSECHPVEADETGATRSFFVTDYHCAIADIAEAFPRVCGHELDLYVELFPDCSVERTHWMIRGESHCGYQIKPQ